MSLKHFTPEEVKGLDEDLAARLDMARDLCGFPIVITCGVRTPEDNARVGGVGDSAHLTGKAADIRRPVGIDQAIQLGWALGLAGLRRFEVADKHFHVDVDPSKPAPCTWLGVSH